MNKILALFTVSEMVDHYEYNGRIVVVTRQYFTKDDLRPIVLHDNFIMMRTSGSEGTRFEFSNH